MDTIFKQVLSASRELVKITDSQVNSLLLSLADATERSVDAILIENQKDLDRMDVTNPKYDRLQLTKERLFGIAADLRNVASLPSPLGKVLDESIRPNGMKITKVTVPFGVIGIIYEARPNVSFDVFSLCLKSGSACLLKGGSDAEFSNKAIVGLIKEELSKAGLNQNTVTLLPSSATADLLNAVGYVDLIIPRGSQSLINYVRENSKIPVIETGASVCHTYFDKAGDVQKGAAIINNAKTRRVSVCNAMDCLIIHSDRMTDLPLLCEKLQSSNVILYADERAFEQLKGHYPNDLLNIADESHFGTEFFDYKMSIKTVDNIDEALEHIAKYSLKHSETIVSDDKCALQLFNQCVDAACVYNNVSTAFTDGAQFGLGAEIGISTQKLHARGPMALAEITSYKWIIEGDGQIRS